MQRPTTRLRRLIGMAVAACVAGSSAQANPAPMPSDAPVFLPGDQPMRNTHEAVRITLRDGISLAADLYRPKGGGRHPVIVEVTPYGKRGDTSFWGERDYWPDRGYAFLVVDTRGQHASGGVFGWFADAIDDGYDIVEWAGTQPWSDGNVGMRGSSYSGTYPWFAARNRPPHLKCINPNATVARSFGELPYHGGVFKTGWALTWISALSNAGVEKQAIDWNTVLAHRPLLTADEAVFGKPLKLYRDMLSHPTLDDYWKPINYGPADYARIALPTLAFSGWFDGTLPGTIFHYQGMRAHSSAAQDQHIVIGPWEHLTAPDGGWDYQTHKRANAVGDMRFPDAAFLPGQKMTAAFFDWCLKGAPKPDLPSARVYITGVDRWLDLPDYPAPGTRRTAFYLGGGGLLGQAKPQRGGVDRYTYDPADPMPSTIQRDGKPFALPSEPVDIGALLTRPDVLVYASPPLATPLTVLGNVRMELFAASSAKDTDFVVQIEDVAPDGSAVKLGPQNGGVIRARYREGYDREMLLTPGRIERYDIDLFDIGHQFRAGHRIRVSITSSSWPFHHRNPNTGNPIATDTAEPVKANQTIHRTAQYPSHIVLPVIDNPGDRK